MLSLIAAIAQNNCIGKDNALPWHLPEDLKHFKELTLHKTVLMGRKTWESIPEKFRPLPQRKNAVISRQKEYSVPEGVLLFDSITSAITTLSGEEIFIIGGAQMYQETINAAQKLYITQVHQTVEGDAFFPTIDPAVWKEVEREDHEGFSFVTYEHV